MASVFQNLEVYMNIQFRLCFMKNLSHILVGAFKKIQLTLWNHFGVVSKSLDDEDLHNEP